MKVKPLALAAAFLFVLGSADADAWPWSRNRNKKRLPKPIDSPVARQNVPEDHKPGNKQRHASSKYDRPEWGAQWKQTLTVKEPRPTHSWVLDNQ